MPDDVAKLKDNRGAVYDVPADEAPAYADRYGWVPASDEDVAGHQRTQKYQQPSEKLKAGLVGLSRVATLGASNYLLDPEYIRDLDEQLPVLTGAVEVGGTIGAALLTGGGSLLAKGAAGGVAGVARGALSATARGGLTRGAMRSAAGIGEWVAGGAAKLGAGERMAGLARHVVREGLEGTAFGVMQGNKQIATDGDYERAASEVMSGAMYGVGFGAGLGIAGIGAKAVSSGVGSRVSAGVDAVRSKASSLRDRISPAAIKAFSEARGMAPGPAAVLEKAAARMFKAYEKTTGKSAKAGRWAMADDETMMMVHRRAAEEKVELSKSLTDDVNLGFLVDSRD